MVRALNSCLVFRSLLDLHLPNSTPMSNVMTCKRPSKQPNKLIVECLQRLRDSVIIEQQKSNRETHLRLPNTKYNPNSGKKTQMRMRCMEPISILLLEYRERTCLLSMSTIFFPKEKRNRVLQELAPMNRVKHSVSKACLKVSGRGWSNKQDLFENRLNCQVLLIITRRIC